METFGLQGRVGEIPTAEEYMDGLQTHELFVYFGHGSGTPSLNMNLNKKFGSTNGF